MQGYTRIPTDPNGDFTMAVADVTTPDGAHYAYLASTRSRFSSRQSTEGWFGDTVGGPPEAFVVRLVDEPRASEIKRAILEGAEVLDQEVMADWTENANPHAPQGRYLGLWQVCCDDEKRPQAYWLRTEVEGRTVFHMFGAEWRGRSVLRFQEMKLDSHEARRSMVDTIMAGLASPILYVRETWI